MRELRTGVQIRGQDGFKMLRVCYGDTSDFCLDISKLRKTCATVFKDSDWCISIAMEHGYTHGDTPWSVIIGSKDDEALVLLMLKLPGCQRTQVWNASTKFVMMENTSC